MGAGGRAWLWRAALSLLGAGLLAAVAWWLGPLLPPLEPAWARGGVAGLLLALWAGGNSWLLLRRRRREAALAAGLQGGADEVDAVGAQFAQAIGQARASGGLYGLPWYVIIGPPGAGKTTALLNAGFAFPLGEKPIPGVGGTRHCDWWFTGGAVLIDTAGRYTTQDSDAASDRAGWLAFLDLLRRTRTRQPLNGVIVAIPAVEVAGAPDSRRLAHAQAVRARVAELDERLRARLPVYLLFTKADLVAGFTEFFDDLDTERRRQVWGTTFAWRKPPDLAAAWAGLVQRLEGRMLARLQAERSPERRALIAGFPAQVASLLPPLGRFVEEAFAGSRLRPAPLLRGVYLASGIQDGTPVDRLTGVLARAFGVDQRRAPALRPEGGRSYFLHRLLAGVLPEEAMLVSTGPEAVRRGRWLRAAGFAGALLATAAGCGTVWLGHAAGAAQQRALDAALDAVAAEAARRPLDPVADTDLAGVLPLLDRARDLPFGRDAAAAGLDQAAALGAASRSAYRHALDRTLLPRLVRRLERQVAGALDRPDFAYEAVRVYLMLGGAGPLDAALVREWLRLDWASLYQGPGFAATRDHLGLHLDALLAAPLPPVPLDGALVERARATFGQVSPAARVYARIRGSAAARRVPPWLPRDALGVLGGTLFARSSGRGLDEGVPGLFTAAGFHDVLLPAIGPAIGAMAAESWVLGARSDLAADPVAASRLEQGLMALYEADFIRAWDQALGDLQVVPLRNVSQAAQDLYILASAQSPMRALLGSVVQQVTLGGPSARDAGGAADRPAAERAAAGPAQPGDAIAAHFRPLRDFVGDGPGAPVDQALRSLTESQQMLAKMAQSAAAVPPGADPAAALRADLPRWPAPVSRWMRSIAEGVSALRGAH